MLNDPAVKAGFLDIIRDAKNQKELEDMKSAKQTIIGYYYDMLCVMALRKMGSKKGDILPDIAPVIAAVTEINRACANQKKRYLFSRTITSPADLFAFASGIAMPRES